MAESTSHSPGIGLAGATFLVLLVAKLWGVIDWSWLYVTMPLWIIPAAVLAFVAALFLVYLIIQLAIFIADLITYRFNFTKIRADRRRRRAFGKAGKSLTDLQRSLERRRL